MDINLIVAMDNMRGIGNKNKLPWSHPEDLKNFKNLTDGHVIVMGRKTFESIGKKLPNRTNVVITSSNEKLHPNVCQFRFLSDAVQFFREKKIFVIGGAELFKEAIPIAENIFLTKINNTYECDTFMPDFETNFGVKDVRQFDQFTIYHCKRIHPENRYIDLINDILLNGMKKPDRTGTGTLSVFGRQIRFPLNRFPLLTTKKTYFRGIAEELFWFLRGSTDNAELNQKDVHIWDANSSKEFMAGRGLNYPDNQLGPIYGFQWRHSGGDYSNKEIPGGIDQIQQLVDEIKKMPDSRRHILCAWNPTDLPKMSIPPCHVMCQFYVRNKYLDCQLYQRSGDVGLGVPFNIASYSLLTYLVAHCCDLIPGEFIHVFGDAHVYLNHVEALKVQVERSPYRFPTLKINTDQKNIFLIKFEDLVLENYISHPAIKMDMSV